MADRAKRDQPDRIKMNIEHTTYRPWESKTIEQFTLNELVHWVHWYAKGQDGHFDPELLVHNVLLWQREQQQVQ